MHHAELEDTLMASIIMQASMKQNAKSKDSLNNELGYIVMAYHVSSPWKGIPQLRGVLVAGSSMHLTISLSSHDHMALIQ